MCIIASKVYSIVRCNSSYATVVKFMLNVSAVLETVYVVPSLTTQIVGIVEDNVPSDVLTGNSPQTY